jgi:hypothetical protein
MDASMTSVIRATIPLLTAPLVDICSPGDLDSLHVALMSTLSAHLLPTWDASRPSLGAPLRVLHLAPNTVPRPIDKAAQQIRIKGADWVSLLLVHNRTRAMSISVDPGMVAVQLAEQPVPTVCWQEDLASNSTTRASSPISSTPSSSSSSSHSAEAPWNARKSRLPSLVARQPLCTDSSSAKMLVGSPRTPKSLNGFTFPLSTATSASASGAPQLPSDVFYRRTEEEEPSWMTSLLSNFPDTPAPSAPSGHHSRVPSQTSLRANAPAYRPAHVLGGLRPAGAGHARSESTDSWASSTRSSPTSTTQHRLSPIGSSPSTTAAASNANGGIYSQLALNMSQLSLASTSTSSSCAPSLSSSASSTSSQRAASPTDQLIPGADGFYNFDVSAGNMYYDDGLPSPISPTASVYAYVDHAARKSVTEYECGKVGVLGGAVMLGVPTGPKKKQNRNSMPPMSTLTTPTNTLPQRGPLPNFDLAMA